MDLEFKRPEEIFCRLLMLSNGTTTYVMIDRSIDAERFGMVSLIVCIVSVGVNVLRYTSTSLRIRPS
jgi:hypothetical protein